MSEAIVPEPALSADQEWRVEKVCQRFEAAWKEGGRPRIEDHLLSESGPVRRALVHELLALELTYRRRLAEEPRAEDYQQRFPGVDFRRVVVRVDAARETLPHVDTAMPVDAVVPKPIPGLEIGEQIARGGMGAVYKAYQPALDRLVALKTVRPELLTSAGLELFKREAKLLAKFSHPHVVKILEFQPTVAVPYFLMEYVDGRPLDRALRGSTWQQRARVFQQVAGAIAVAHAHGVVHGDVKPANILVDRDSQPHILDFGLGHLARSEHAADEPDHRGGTPGFLAPETLLEGSPSSYLSDIYALGVTLYVVLTGVMPFASRQQMADGALRLPLEYNADVPEPLQRICLKAMEPKPQDRYQTAEHLRQDLERFCNGQVVFVRPTFYERELTGHIGNHTAAIQMWEQAGLVSQRERDALVLPYRRLIDRESPWLSETRRVLGGPLLIRLGAWLLLLSAILWPAFYWDLLDTSGRLASSGLPMLFMAGLSTALWRAGQRRNAVVCLGSCALLLLVFTVVCLSEFHWLRFVQDAEWELWGERVQQPALQAAAAHDFLDELVLSNSQILAAMVFITACIVLLLRLTRAVFFAPWLALAFVGSFTAVFLVCGDWFRLHNQAIAMVAWHYLVPAVVLLFLGFGLEQRRWSPMAVPFYALGVFIFLSASVAAARFGTEEWFQRRWDWEDQVWNLWLLSYGVPLFTAAWALERFGSETQRYWSWLLYLLVPVFVQGPLNMLFDTGPRITAPLGTNPIYLYEALCLPASAAFLWLGKKLQLETFLYAGLAGLAVFLFRVTAAHCTQEPGWPIAVASTGTGLVALGIGLSRRKQAR